MNQKDMQKLQEGLTVSRRMNRGISLPMQGVSFSEGELVTVTPYRLGASIVVVRSKTRSGGYVEMALDQVQKFVDSII